MKKVSYYILPALVVLIALCSFRKAPPAAEENGIKWMTWTEMQKAQKKHPRKVVVDVYTSWCGWCKTMDKNTFTNPEIIKYVNENFYAIKFDAETKDTINFKGKLYGFIPPPEGGNRGCNHLAIELLNGQLSYPTTVYLDEQLNTVMPPVIGYQDAKRYELVLNYVKSNSYKNTDFTKYEESFQGKVQP